MSQRDFVIRECEDCGEEMQDRERRRRCKNCGQMICGWCRNHTHALAIYLAAQAAAEANTTDAE